VGEAVKGKAGEANPNNSDILVNQDNLIRFVKDILAGGARSEALAEAKA
jgi:hypothetical protein